MLNRGNANTYEHADLHPDRYGHAARNTDGKSDINRVAG
jgi:hypothetical protein